jgi:hypothetical protein
MAGVAATVCGDRKNTDTFEPIKLAAALYAVSLGVAPLLYATSIGIDEREAGPVGASSLWAYAAFIALIGLLAMVLGYLAVGRLTPKTARGSRPQVMGYRPSSLLSLAAILGVLGVISYLALVYSAGGFSSLLQYTGSRVRIFGGAFGGFYWGSFLLISAVALYCATKFPRSLIGPAVVTSAVAIMLWLFQGRSLAMAPLFCLVVLFHYRVRPISARVVLTLVGVAVLAAALLGVLREANKSEAYGDIAEFVAYFYNNIGDYLTLTVLRNIEQLDVVALAVQYIERGGPFLMGWSLTQWLEPVDRLLFGDKLLPSVHIGSFLLEQMGPQYRGVEGALSPSLTAEMYTNLGVPGVFLGLFGFGALLRAIYRPIEARAATQIHYAIYSYVLWVSVTSVIDGTVSWFKAVVFATPLLLALFLYPKPKAPRQASQKPPAILSSV